MKFPEFERKPPEVPETTIKSFYVTKRLIDKLGRTPGYPACDLRGGAHTDACRSRIVDEVLADPAERAKLEQTVTGGAMWA